VGKGIGLGLSVAHDIMHDVGDHIVVDTAPGSGTVMRLLFPTTP